MKIARKIQYRIYSHTSAKVLSGPTWNHVTTGKTDITAKITVFSKYVPLPTGFTLSLHSTDSALLPLNSVTFPHIHFRHFYSSLPSVKLIFRNGHAQTEYMIFWIPYLFKRSPQMSQKGGIFRSCPFEWIQNYRIISILVAPKKSPCQVDLTSFSQCRY